MIFFRILRKITLHSCRGYCWFRCRFSALWWESRVAWGKRLRIEVPVSFCASRGRIRLDDGISLGFLAAPKEGNGRILLQAREPEAVIEIGKGSHFSNNISLIARKRISIGEHFLCGNLVEIIDSDFHGISPEGRLGSDGESLPVSIGRNVWLGDRVLVLKGASIGDNCIVAAGSVVTGTLPPNTVCAGVPACVIRSLI